MYTAILLLLAIAGLVLAFLIYRVLIRSEGFARLIGGAIEPPPETADEVLSRLRAEKARATDRAGKCRVAASRARQTADEIDDELRPKRRRSTRSKS